MVGKKGQTVVQVSGFWNTPNIKAWALVWLGFAFLPTTINAFSLLTEYDRTNRAIAAWEPFLWEYSSGIGVLLALPLVRWSVNHTPSWSQAPLRFVAQYAATAVGFCVLHLTAMVTLRLVAYAAIGQTYALDALWGDLPSEIRRDLLTYLLVILIVVGVRHLIRLSRTIALVEAAGTAATPAETPRMEIKVGSRRLFLAPADILMVRSAGNYIEVVTGESVHLVRRTLAEFQTELPGGDFARVHRSHIVNRAAITRVDSRPSGDMDITLSNGAVVAASRRYKSELF